MRDSRGGSLTRGILGASLGFGIQVHVYISHVGLQYQEYQGKYH